MDEPRAIIAFGAITYTAVFTFVVWVFFVRSPQRREVYGKRHSPVLMNASQSEAKFRAGGYSRFSGTFILRAAGGGIDFRPHACRRIQHQTTRSQVPGRS